MGLPARTPTARSPAARHGSDPRRSPRRELLRDRGSLPREPVAARAPEPRTADAGHRSGPAARVAGGSASIAAGCAACVARRDPLCDQPVGSRVRRRPAAGAGARVDGVGLPAGRRLERRRDRGHAASSRDVGVRRHGACSASARHETTKATCAREFATCAGSSTSSEANVRLALAGWYQGARAVREIGLYDDTKLFVRVVLSLHGTV